jgi:hypothetical protein
MSLAPLLNVPAHTLGPERAGCSLAGKHAIGEVRRQPATVQCNDALLEQNAGGTSSAGGSEAHSEDRELFEAGREQGDVGDGDAEHRNADDGKEAVSGDEAMGSGGSAGSADNSSTGGNADMHSDGEMDFGSGLGEDNQPVCDLEEGPPNAGDLVSTNPHDYLQAALQTCEQEKAKLRTMSLKQLRHHHANLLECRNLWRMIHKCTSEMAAHQRAKFWCKRFQGMYDSFRRQLDEVEETRDIRVSALRLSCVSARVHLHTVRTTT